MLTGTLSHLIAVLYTPPKRAGLPCPDRMCSGSGSIHQSSSGVHLNVVYHSCSDNVDMLEYGQNGIAGKYAQTLCRKTYLILIKKAQNLLILRLRCCIYSHHKHSSFSFSLCLCGAYVCFENFSSHLPITGCLFLRMLS